MEMVRDNYINQCRYWVSRLGIIVPAGRAKKRAYMVGQGMLRVSVSTVWCVSIDNRNQSRSPSMQKFIETGKISITI